MEQIKLRSNGYPFADDLTIFCRGKNIYTTEKIIQETLNNLFNWILTNGFKFSPSKTECLIFSKNSDYKENLQLTMDNKPLTQVQNIKILGIFDQKLNWKKHIENLKREANSRLNILKIMSAKNWGAENKSS